MKDVLAQKGVTAKYIVNAIKFYVNLHIMDAIVLKGIVPQIIVHAISMGENAIHKDVKIAIYYIIMIDVEICNYN
jgi:hypothetical protein